MSSTPPQQSASNAFVTLLTSDDYLPGALVLAESLRLSHGLSRKGKQRAVPFTSASTFEIVALITPETLSIQSIRALRRSGLFDWIIGVEPIGFKQILSSSNASQPIPTPSNDGTSTLDPDLNERALQMEKNLSLLGRPDLSNTLTKLHAWRLGRDSKDVVASAASSVTSSATWQGFDRIVFLDADTLVLRRIDHLFRMSGDPHFAAAPDTGWPDSFNSGVMLLKPALPTFEAMRTFARSTGSWDGADQGLLNDFFGSEFDTVDETAAEQAAPGKGWKRLSFRYNVTSHGGYTFAPAYQRYGSTINIVHFIGTNKPWKRQRPHGSAVPNPLADQSSTGGLKITPDQPDYLVSLWHSAFASLYPLSNSSSPGDVTVVHTERGVEVIETPRFSVPTYHALWDVAAQDEQGDLTDDQDDNEATYVSLPLDGRISLIAPVPSIPVVKVLPPSPEELVASEESSPPRSGHNSPEYFEPPRLTWDPAREPPPSGTDPSSYQMRIPIDTVYANKWDEASRNPRSLAEQKAAFFVPPQSSQTQQTGGPGYIPPKLIRDNVFGNLGGHQPDPSKVKPVFPWEGKQDHSSRVFPDDPRPPTPSPPSTSSKTTPAPKAAPQPSRIGLPNNLSYVNAWDQEGAIGNFADLWSSRGYRVPAQARPRQQPSGSSPAAVPEQAGARSSPNAPTGSQKLSRASGLESPVSGDEASDSRDGDDESSSANDDSDDDPNQPEGKEGLNVPTPSSHRHVTWPRNSPSRGYTQKAEQVHGASRSPRMGNRNLSYTSPAADSASGGGLLSSSSNTSSNTVNRDGATRQRARDRIRPDGWVSPSGNFNSPPKSSGYYPATASLRGIPQSGGASSFGNNSPSMTHRSMFGTSFGQTREVGSSNESMSSGANSPTALLSPSLTHLSTATSMFNSPATSPMPMPGAFPSRRLQPPGSR